MRKNGKRILIITGKFPASGTDIDGGSILVYTLIEALKGYCCVDILFTRREHEAYKNIQGVENVYFETYCFHLSNKFERRLVNYRQIISRIKSLAPLYDKILIVHVSKAFGINELSETEREKIVLFPMFMSSSYERSGETLPVNYKKLEYDSIKSVKHIISPSEFERKEIVEGWEVPVESIKIIPRSIGPAIKAVVHKLRETVNLLYIASVKPQKNTLHALKLLKRLRDANYEVCLRIVGGIQDSNYFNSCDNYINANCLNEYVIFCGAVSQLELSGLIASSDINISTSRCETFGRGIFEGMAGGLPTLVYSSVECIGEYVRDGYGILMAKDFEDMVKRSIELLDNKEYYHAMSVQAINEVKKLSFESEKENLRSAILKDILIILGTRPECIKLMPVIDSFKKKHLPFKLLNTNQHPDIVEKTLATKDINIDFQLASCNCGSSLLEKQNFMLSNMEKCIDPNDYKLVLVQGDTLSAFVGALYAFSNGIKVGHIEAGLRTYDIGNPFPEESYRQMISTVSSFHFCPSVIEVDNLKREGKTTNVFLTGNTFVDYRLGETIVAEQKPKVLITIHRRENIKCIERILTEIKTLALIHKELMFIFPVHPNPLLIDKCNEILGAIENIHLSKPLPANDFYRELLESVIVISDSGGVQEECILSSHKIIIVRAVTERRHDFEFTRLVNPEVDSIIEAFDDLLKLNVNKQLCFYYGLGNSADMISDIIIKHI